MQQMTKSEFLESLAGSLYAYNDLTDEMVEKQLKQFDRYFSRMSDEEVQTAIADFDSTETIAANIYSLIKDKERQKAAYSGDKQTQSQQQPRIRDYDHTAADFTIVDSHTATDTGATSTYNTVNRRPTPAKTDTDIGGDTINLDRVKPGDIGSSGQNLSAQPASDNNYEANSEFETGHLDFTSLDDAPAQVSPMFWVLFVLTFPLWGTIIITILVLFLFAFAALASLIVALVAAMIGVAAAGTGLSLFGIIYGITQTFDIFSAGLFEIGLGVTIGGSAMFAGIAIYNIAIRFLPFVMKKLTVFLHFTLRSLKHIFLRIKKECVTQ